MDTHQNGAPYRLDAARALFLFLTIIAGACSDFSRPPAGNASAGSSAKENPAAEKQTPRPKPARAAEASKITKIIFSDWRHEGPVSAPGGRVVSNTFGFARDGAAFKSENAVSYDDGRKEPPAEYAATITTAQFEKLAAAAAENDFLNESDSPNARSESENRLTIFYEGGEKSIVTGSDGEDTPQIAAILRVLEELKNLVEWKRK